MPPKKGKKSQADQSLESKSSKQLSPSGDDQMTENKGIRKSTRQIKKKHDDMFVEDFQEERINKPTKKQKEKQQKQQKKEQESGIQEEQKKDTKARGQTSKRQTRSLSLERRDHWDQEETFQKKIKSNLSTDLAEIDPVLELPRLILIGEDSRNFSFEKDVAKHIHTEKKGSLKMRIYQDPTIKTDFQYCVFTDWVKPGQELRWSLMGGLDLGTAKLILVEELDKKLDELKKIEEETAEGFTAQVQKEDNNEEAEESDLEKRETKGDEATTTFPVDEYVPNKEEVELIIEGTDVFHTQFNSESEFKIVQGLKYRHDHSKHYLYIRKGDRDTVGEWILEGTFPEGEAIRRYREESSKSRSFEYYP